MKILLYNPNTSEAITEKLYETAKLVVSSETTLIPKTAEKGFPYISTKVEAQITGTLVLEKLAEIHSQYDAIIIAAFGDPGLIPAKSLFNLPIIGLGEAAMLSACLFVKNSQLYHLLMQWRLGMKKVLNYLDYSLDMQDLELLMVLI